MALLHPGTSATELDFSQYIQNIPTSAFGIVGVFSQGPVNQATLVTSFAAAQAMFGTYLDASGYYGMLALKAFFANGGGIAYVVRVTHVSSGATTSVAATTTLVDRAGSPLSTLKVSAVNQGTWGNTLTVTITASTAYPTTGFNLTVLNNAVVVEQWNDLLIGTLNNAQKDYVERRINRNSLWIVVQDQLSVTAAPNNRPAIAAGTALSTGNDGLSGLTVADYIGSSSVGNGLYALGGAPINFVAIPGAVDATSAFGGALNAGIITYCESRSRVIGILDTPQGQTPQTLSDFRNGTGSYSHAAFNSSYAALYAGWLWVTHPVTGAQVKSPPSGFVAGIYARVDTLVAPWQAPAGMNYGVVQDAVTTEFSPPSPLLQPGDEDTLYSNNINYITLKQGSLVVWGQETTQIKASATNRVNVRRLLALVESSVQGTALFFVDKPNIKTTWEEFKRTVSPFLQGIQDAVNPGIKAFVVICDDTTNTSQNINNNTMAATIAIIPVRAIDFIPLTFEIALDGAVLGPQS